LEPVIVEGLLEEWPLNLEKRSGIAKKYLAVGEHGMGLRNSMSGGC
jgi:hypothetical protein